jgi:hypothetical protein
VTFGGVTFGGVTRFGVTFWPIAGAASASVRNVRRSMPQFSPE